MQFRSLHAILPDLNPKIINESLWETHQSGSQLNECSSRPTLVLWRGGKPRDVRMIREQFRNCLAQCSGAVAVDYAHFGLTVQESLVKEFVGEIDCFVGCLADEI